MRNTIELKIDNEKSRDHGKVFVVTEMPAEKAEWWAFRALTAIAGQSEVSLGNPQMENLSAFGVRAIASIPPEVSKPLLDEMMQCVSVKLADGKTRDLLPTDTEEVSTRLQLRMKFMELHTGFLELGAA